MACIVCYFSSINYQLIYFFNVVPLSLFDLNRTEHVCIAVPGYWPALVFFIVEADSVYFLSVTIWRKITRQFGHW
jgi:hypothetical protein